MARGKRGTARSRPGKLTKRKKSVAGRTAVGTRGRYLKTKRSRKRPRGQVHTAELVAYELRGLGARSAGQSGDTQGLSATPGVNSESVQELMEEGQAFEAEVLDGVENAPDADRSEVFTREVNEDDVPEEYRGEH